MNKRKIYIFTTAGLLLILSVSLLLVWLAYCHIHAAAAVMAVLLCAAVLAVAARTLLLRFAPALVAERWLKQFIQADKTVYAAHFDDGEDEGPILCFHAKILQYEGLRVLFLSDIAPNTAECSAKDNADWQLSLFDNMGNRQVCFFGTLDVSSETVRLLVRSVELSGRKKPFFV